MGQITVEKLNTQTKRVEKVLREFPITRDDDMELWAKVCELFYPPLERPIFNYRDFSSVLRSLPTMSEIERARRKVIRKHGYKKYLPTLWFVAERRKIAEKVWAEYARDNLPETQMSFSNIPGDRNPEMDDRR